MKKTIVLSAIVVVLMIGAQSANAQTFMEVVNTKDQKNITEGIIIVNFAIPKEGINLIYKYKDHTSGTVGMS